MKGIAVFLLVLAIAIAGCTQTTQPTPSPSMASATTPTSTATLAPTATPTVQPTATAEPTSTASATPQAKEFTMTAKNWGFTPSTITVKKGDFVRLKVKSVDVTHGFSIPEYGIKEDDISPGKEVVIEFTADKAGTFTFSCSVFCGTGHTNMKGTLIVEE